MGTGPVRRAIAVAMAMVLLAGACSDGDRDDGAVPEDGGDAPAGDGPFRLALGEGAPLGVRGASVPVVDGEALGAGDVDAVTSRLPALAGEDGDRQPFARPAETLPRPRVGRTVEAPLAPAGSAPPATAPDGPLEVRRFQPDGEVDVAPSVSVTFDRPMVPVGTLEQLDTEEVPVRIEPAIDGRWRWIGTRTLRFEADAAGIDRLPGATEYTVEVPAGTASADGSELPEAVRWTFATPAPQVRTFLPEGDVVDVRPVLAVVFDQRVDPDEVLDDVVVTAGGDERDIRLATTEEVAADEIVRQHLDQVPDGRWVAVRPVDALPGDTPVELTVGEGTPSAEGPRRSTEAVTHRTRTRPAFAVSGTECGVPGRGCRPGDHLTIVLTTPVDPATFDPTAIEVDPPVASSIQAWDDRIVLSGATSPGTTYEVTLPADLRDRFGQQLGEAETVRFEVGDPAPFLRPFPTQLVTVDPYADQPKVSVTSAGQRRLKVTVRAVDVDDLDAYVRFWERWDGEDMDPLPGRQIASDTVDAGGDAARITETQIDLTPAMPGGRGHAIVVVEPTERFPRDSEEHWQSRPTVAWVQGTGIGLDAISDHERLVTWATDLRDGTALDGVRVRMLGRDAAATTGAGGLAELPLAGLSRAVVAETDGDVAVLIRPWDGWQEMERRDEARWSVFDDRGIYRPGEQVHVKGWVRRLTLSEDARIRPVGASATVEWVAHDALGTEVATGTAPLTAAGGFHVEFDLPAGAATGPAYLELRLAGTGGMDDSFGHQLLIEEFRRPAFEVRTRAESQAPHRLTRALTLAAEAAYFAGGVLADAPVTWQVTTRPATYQPPNWPQFSFGRWTPPWYGWGGDAGFAGRGAMIDSDIGGCCFPDEEAEHHTYEARTDATGTDHLRVDFEGQRPDEPITVSANASVEDVDRQAFGSTVDVLVHPGSLYVGLRGERTFVREGEPLEVEVVVTDIDGRAVADRRVALRAARVLDAPLTRNGDSSEPTEVEGTAEDCEVTSETEPVTCRFEPDVAGQYRITATVTDDDGGRHRSELTRWVSGAHDVAERTVDEQPVTIIPAATEHAPGDTAELLVLSPFTPAQGLLTVSRHGIEETRRFEITDGAAVLEVDITDASIPGIGVRVDVVGAAPRVGADGEVDDDLPPRPAHGSGTLTIPVEATTKTLDVRAVPTEDELEPGGSTTVDVTVEGPDGGPVPDAEVALAVVDEAVWSLIAKELPDPVAAIHQPLSELPVADRLRSTLQLANPETLGGDGDPPDTTIAAEMLDQMGGDDSGEEASGGATADMDTAAQRSAFSGAGGATAPTTPIEVRTDFDALAFFAAALPTDSQGRVSVDVTVPDNLTRYRVVAVAADRGDRFGAGESTITARLPVTVRPSAPRFVNFGDRFELPVVVQNQRDDEAVVDVVLEATNLTVDGTGGRRVRVPANERVEVRFPVAAEDAGTVRFRVTGVSGDAADSAQGQLPAYTPATAEAFATYGVVDDTGAVAQPFVAPEGVFPQFGGLEIDTSSTAVQALTDAVVYLADYPYGSADAYASRIIALVALRDVFAAFSTPGTPTPEELDGRIRTDIEELIGLQRDDGGFATWQRGRPADPYATVQATHALVIAGAAGYPVDAGARDRALGYIAAIDGHLPGDWPADARRAVRAYALWARAEAGARDAGGAEALFREAPDLPLDVLAWLWPVVADPGVAGAITDTFEDRVTETPAGATFTSSYEESTQALVLASDRRTDAIALDALIRMQPGSDLIPKVVAGLVGNQVKGRWNNVQENGFVLLALDRYFDTFETATPDFVARAWIGDAYTAAHEHRGRSVDTTRTVVPVPELTSGDIVLGKDGPGRLYYRLGLRYAPDDLRLDPRDEGFVVERTYEAIDDPDDVRQGDDGTWRIRPGAMVRVRLSMVADAARTNMVLVDPLPAGLEILNQGLAASPRPPAEEADRDDPPTWWGFTWFDHQSARDDRAEAYASYLPAGTYDYTYVARATTPGTFVAPPARAEEIYAPEVFGRSGTDMVSIGG